MRFVLQRLKEKRLLAKFSKCEFRLDKMAFLRHFILTDSIYVDLSKVEAMLDRQRPKTTKEVKSFLGLIGYFKHSVERFTKLTRRITELTYKEVIFRQLNACKQIFQESKKRQTLAPILALSIKGEEYDLYMDGSYKSLRAMLIQRG